MKRSDFNFLLGVVGKIGDVVRELFARRDARLDELARRVRDLEAAPKLKWAGVWRDGQAHAAGSLVTRSGSLWMAENDTVRRPGEDESGWRLIVKSGAYRSDQSA